MTSSLTILLLAALGISLLVGPLGCFAVWRRMAYFGDSLSHSGLLGVALGLVLGVNQHLAVTIICVVIAVILVWLEGKKFLAIDTLLGVIAHTALAIGMVILGIAQTKVNNHASQQSDQHMAMDIDGFLFGDISKVTSNDLLWIFGVAIIVLGIIIYYWQDFIITIIGEELAKAEGIDVVKINLLLLVMMALVVSVSINIVGVLLITSMLIIPAATSRQITRTPEFMAVISVIIAMSAIGLGLICANKFSLQASPAIVVAESSIFMATIFIRTIINRCG